MSPDELSSRDIGVKSAITDSGETQCSNEAKTCTDYSMHRCEGNSQVRVHTQLAILMRRLAVYLLQLS
jgi:hypothetical protein